MNKDRFNYCHASARKCIAARPDGICGLPDIGSCYVYGTSKHITEPRFHHNVRDHLGCETLSNTLIAAELHLRENRVVLPIGGIMNMTLLVVPTFFWAEAGENATILLQYKDPVAQSSWIISPYLLPIKSGSCLQCGRLIEKQRCDQLFCCEACQKRYGRKNKSAQIHRSMNTLETENE